MKATLKSLYEADDYAMATIIRDNILSRVQHCAPKSVALLEEGFKPRASVLNLPFPLRCRLRTTNGIERFNKEKRRKERVIRIFSNEDALYWLISVSLLEMHDSWQAGRMYLDLNSYLAE